MANLSNYKNTLFKPKSDSISSEKNNVIGIRRSERERYRSEQ